MRFIRAVEQAEEIEYVGKHGGHRRPPQREKLLRPAGYSAMRRIDALSEKWMSAAAQAVGAGMFFGLIVGTFYPLLAALAFGPVTPHTKVFLGGLSMPWRSATFGRWVQGFACVL